MKLENQVCSLKYAKRLKELNCKQESLWCWVIQPARYKIEPYLMRLDSQRGYANLIVSDIHLYSAYTSAELGEMLPIHITSEKSNFKKGFFVKATEEAHNELDKTEANARAKILIYLAEHKLINPKESSL